MRQLKDLTENRYQVAEIWQISGSRKTVRGNVCQMQPAQFLSSAPCSMLNNSEGVA
jgi:hypothetical protein